MSILQPMTADEWVRFFARDLCQRARCDARVRASYDMGGGCWVLQHGDQELALNGFGGSGEQAIRTWLSAQHARTVELGVLTAPDPSLT